MKHIVLFFSIFSTCLSFANLSVPNLAHNGVVDRDNNALIDPTVDYNQFIARVTDKDKSGRVLKLKAENNNIKFFKAGDLVYFRVNLHESDIPCKATVKAIEDYYLTIYVNSFNTCWSQNKYFPRGMQLNLSSSILAKRVLEASEYRVLLLKRKDSFLNQLNNINHFLWTYEQQKLKLAAEFDEQINELMRKKQQSLDDFLKSKQENKLLQSELIKKLDDIDSSLKYYKVERNEHIIDRWNLDHDLGQPVGQRPQAMKKP